MGDLQGLRALVTGGTRGVGAAVVARLREEGAAVLATARMAVGNAEDDTFVAADATTPADCAHVAETVRDRLGGIDRMRMSRSGSSN